MENIIDINSPLAIISSLLGLAYPLLLQSIQRLDEKYQSDVVLKHFLKEDANWRFVISLKTCLIVALLSLLGKLNLSRPEYLNLGIPLNFLIDNSNEKIVFVFLFTTTVLVYFFFVLVKKILVYNQPLEFIQYIIRRDEPFKDDSLILRIIIDLHSYSIKSDPKIYGVIHEYSYILKRKIDAELVEKNYYYFNLLVFNNIKEISISSGEKLESDIIPLGLDLLIFNIEKEITENEFRWVWKCLTLFIKHNKTDMIIDSYWKKFFNLISTLKYHPNNDQVNHSVIDGILEFQYKLGGLLIYEKNYNCISRMFRFTNSDPAKYELLPQTMSEIFTYYFNFNHPFNNKYAFIAQEFPFPMMEGLNADYEVKNWINKFIALLFLRQWTVTSFYYFNDPLADPNLPSIQQDKENWIKRLDYFRKTVNEIMQNALLLKEVGFEELNNPDWYQTNGKIYPLKFIDDLIGKIKVSLEQTAINQLISETKRGLFNNSTKEILNITFAAYQKIENVKPIENNFKNVFFNDGYIISILEKNVFDDNHNVAYFDSVYGNEISRLFQIAVSECFFMNKTDKFLFKSENISAAFDNLNLKKDKHIIVGFALNELSLSNVKGLTAKKYKEIDFISFNTANPLTRDCFFILDKNDLPYIKYNDLTEGQIPYNLNQIDETYHIYTDLIDLNNNTELLEKYKDSHPDKDLRKYLLLLIWTSAEFRFRKNMQMICIQMHSDFEERGIINDLDDLKKYSIKLNKNKR